MVFELWILTSCGQTSLLMGERGSDGFVHKTWTAALRSVLSVRQVVRGHLPTESTTRIVTHSARREDEEERMRLVFGLIVAMLGGVPDVAKIWRSVGDPWVPTAPRQLVKKCYPCPRTPVTYVSGPNNAGGSIKTSLRQLLGKAQLQQK